MATPLDQQIEERVVRVAQCLLDPDHVAAYILDALLGTFDLIFMRRLGSLLYLLSDHHSRKSKRPKEDPSAPPSVVTFHNHHSPEGSPDYSSEDSLDWWFSAYATVAKDGLQVLGNARQATHRDAVGGEQWTKGQLALVLKEALKTQGILGLEARIHTDSKFGSDQGNSGKHVKKFITEIGDTCPRDVVCYGHEIERRGDLGEKRTCSLATVVGSSSATLHGAT